jgi:hypothetical protein
MSVTRTTIVVGVLIASIFNGCSSERNVAKAARARTPQQPQAGVIDQFVPHVSTAGPAELESDTMRGTATLPSRGAQMSGSSPSSKRMPDGKHWMTENLNVTAEPSYCYDNSEHNCRRYGRLYTWESAQRACRSLGRGWRVPTNEEWRDLARHYGGLREETPDLGKAAYTALITGGASGFNAAHGGGRTDKSGEYLRADAHGFYL